MESCLLCLDIHSDKMTFIKTGSKGWRNLTIANILEKHFWPLNTIRLNSFICSPCWRLVDDFHKFYLRVEEAHLKFTIKVENEDMNDFCFQKPGADQCNENTNSDVNVKNEPLDVDEDVECMSDISCKQIIGVSTGSCPTLKMVNVNDCKCRKRKCSAEKLLEIKKKSRGLNEDSESASDIDDDDVGINVQSYNSSEIDYPNTEKHLYKNHSSCEENDKFIIDFLKQINCNICKIKLENFSALQTHFLECHQQKGYILCCSKKFFVQNDLADHIHSHLNPNQFRCDQCDKMFPGRVFLEQHKLCDHSSDRTAKEHFCDVCGHEFLNVERLKIHKLCHLTEKERNKFYMSFTENNFEEPNVPRTQKINANHHSALPNVSHTLFTDFSEPLTSSTTSSFCQNDVKNEDIFTLLKEILLGQKVCNARLKKIEQNQTKMLHHEIMLSDGQVTIINNQQQITEAVQNIGSSIETNPEVLTQTNLSTDCKIFIKTAEELACRMNSKTCDKEINEIANMLPLKSLAAVQEVEQKLRTPDFAQAMMVYLHKVKGISEDVSSVIRVLFTDDLLEKFNWEGRWEKQSLGKLMLFNKTLRDVFQQQTAFDFEKSVKKSIERSHRRVNQKKYLKKENK